MVLQAARTSIHSSLRSGEEERIESRRQGYECDSSSPSFSLISSTIAVAAITVSQSDRALVVTVLDSEFSKAILCCESSVGRSSTFLKAA
jgi:hypothetical protein